MLNLGKRFLGMELPKEMVVKRGNLPTTKVNLFPGRGALPARKSI